MPDEPEGERPTYPNPHEEDIMAGDRRLSRPDASLPDWEVPDTSYRPIPIVWFTGAFLTHLVTAMAILLILGRFGPWATVPAAGLAAGLIGAWTWERGMASASTGWKIATVLILLFDTLFVLSASS
jgi:hypothetical protein